MATIHAWAAPAAGKTLERFSYDPVELRDDQVEIAVESCGICHSDLSMIHNEWGNAVFPLVPGHEIVGRVTAVGPRAKRVQAGDRVGLGWFSESCNACPDCLSGDQNLCATAEQTIVGRHGGFADRVRAHWTWATPLPEVLEASSAGPLFCGGITVFNPLVQAGIRPTDRIGVVGIGGLGHLAVQFADKWGCEVVAFSSDESKTAELHELGADAVLSSRHPETWKKYQRSFALILVTVNVPLDWGAMIELLRPRGLLHFVGAVLAPIEVAAFSLIMAQRSISGTPLGSPVTTATMLDFCARHGIAPIVERFSMDRVNEALEHLQHGKPRYRVVLDHSPGG